MKTSAELFAFVAVALGASLCVETMSGYAHRASAGQDPTAAAPDPELLELMKAFKVCLPNITQICVTKSTEIIFDSLVIENLVDGGSAPIWIENHALAEDRIFRLKMETYA